MITLDCKGLPCPQPVLETKKCIEIDAPQSFEIIVDNDAARENVSRFLGTRGYEASSVAKGDGLWVVTGSKNGDAAVQESKAASPAAVAEVDEKITVFIPANVIGSGDDELGGKLMLNFLATLPELGETLWRVVLVNGGVKLAIPSSPCFEKLKALEDAGATVLVCGTCLEHFDLMSQRGLGQTTNMLDVVTSLQLATKVIHV